MIRPSMPLLLPATPLSVHIIYTRNVPGVVWGRVFQPLSNPLLHYQCVHNMASTNLMPVQCDPSYEDPPGSVQWPPTVYPAS